LRPQEETHPKEALGNKDLELHLNWIKDGNNKISRTQAFLRDHSQPTKLIKGTEPKIK